MLGELPCLAKGQRQNSFWFRASRPGSPICPKPASIEVHFQVRSAVPVALMILDLTDRKAD